jgi:hypothetical protein
MRVEIEGSWTAKDMAESLSSLRELYNVRLGIQMIYEDYRDAPDYIYEMRHLLPFRRRRYLNPFLLQQALIAGSSFTITDPAQISRLIAPEEELKVRRIDYASPGLKDLAGLGDIVGHVKDFTLKLIEHFSSRRKRELLDEEQKLKNEALRIQNARNFINLMEELGLDELERRRLVGYVDEKQEPLIRLVAEGKIQNVLMLDEQHSGKRE